MTDWIDALKQAGRQAESFAARHPRALTGGVVGLLSTFAVAAFGIAPLAPDARDIPQHQVSESVPLAADLSTQLSALAANTLVLSRSDVTRGSDTADSLLRRMGAFDTHAAAFLRSDPLAKRILSGRVGKMVQLSADADGQVQSMVARYPAEQPDQISTDFTRLSVVRTPTGFISKIETVPLQSQIRLGSGTVHSSLFAATDEANIPDAVASQLADMFSGDIDFHRELKKGDRFSIVFESMTADGEPISWDSTAGHIVAADFVNNGKTYSAVWYRDASNGHGSYYGLNGESKRRAFLASPLEFSRITSGFAMRFHPILNTWKHHDGIDYGAPTGTAVRSVGDATVSFAGWQNGYGNVIHLTHAGNRETVYAHLSRIDVKKGQHVEQGQNIGAVGMTGWATGPHLHFEFHVAGKLVDPRVIARDSSAVPLPATARAQFRQVASVAETQLQVAATLGTGTTN